MALNHYQGVLLEGCRRLCLPAYPQVLHREQGLVSPGEGQGKLPRRGGSQARSFGERAASVLQGLGHQ